MCFFVFFFKQKTAYEMRISDWSSDVCSSDLTMLQSLLIANRGEIACRIIRTAREMAIRTVAVYSDADAKALHVRQADEAVHIGPSPARESYLKIGRAHV